VAKYGELACSDVERQLLQGVLVVVDDEEPDEVARWPDRQLLEVQLVRPPVRERQLPRQVEEPIARFAQPQTRKRGQVGGVARQVGQSRFRRYAVTLAS
jgi:hypothetical protein